jgi:hypothetical protein
LDGVAFHESVEFLTLACFHMPAPDCITYLKTKLWAHSIKNIYFKFLVNNSSKMMKFGGPHAKFNKNLSSTATILFADSFNRIAKSCHLDSQSSSGSRQG